MASLIDKISKSYESWAEAFGKSKGLKMTPYGSQLSSLIGQRQSSYGPEISSYGLVQSVSPSASKSQTNQQVTGQQAQSMTGENPLSAFYNQAKEDQIRTLEKIYKSQKEYANKAYSLDMASIGDWEKSVNERYPQLIAQTNETYDSNIPLFQQQKELALRDIESGRQGARSSEKSAINTASRLYNELATGIPKYAGTSVAGAYGEILGRGTAEDISNAQSQLQVSLKELDNKAFDANREYDRIVNENNRLKKNEVQQLNYAYLDQIRAINASKRESEKNKAALEAGAFQNYQNSLSETVNKYNQQIAEINYQRELQQAQLRTQATQIQKALSVNEVVSMMNALSNQGYQVPASSLQNLISSVGTQASWEDLSQGLVTGGGQVPGSDISSNDILIRRN